MRKHERTRKVLSILLCVLMLVQYVPTTAFAVGSDNLCEHHATHTAECGYAEAVAGSDCTHIHDGSCGYAEPVAEVKCACEATDENGALVHTEGCGYVAPVEGSNCTHAHDEACGYVAAVEAHECHYECAECAAAAASEEAPEESSDPAPVCDCGTDDPAIHATTCAVYVAPENPKCFCATKCTEANVWCDVCGFDYTACTGTDRSAGYGTGWEIEGTTLNVTGHLTALPEGVEYSEIEVRVGGNLDLGEATVTCDVFNDGTISGGIFENDVVNSFGSIIGGTFKNDVVNDGTIIGGTFTGHVSNYGTITDVTFWYATVSNKSEYATISNAKFESNAKLAEGSTPPQSVIHSVNGKDVALTYNAPLPAALGTGAAAWYEGSTQVTGGSVPLNYTTYVGEYAVNTAAATNGTVSVDPATAKFGQTVAVTADASKSYVLDTLSVTDASGKSVDVVNNQFTMPASAVTVNAAFVVCDHKGSQHKYIDNENGISHHVECSVCGGGDGEPHTIDSTTGKCEKCGAECTHRNFDSATGNCTDCETSVAIAKIETGGNTTYYQTADDLRTAVANNSADQAVTLLADIAIIETVDFWTRETKNTLDLNGHTLICSDPIGERILVTYCELTITGTGSINIFMGANSEGSKIVVGSGVTLNNSLRSAYGGVLDLTNATIPEAGLNVILYSDDWDPTTYNVSDVLLLPADYYFFMDGKAVYTYSGETEGTVLKHTEHSYTYTNNGDGTHDATCSVCGKMVDNEAHTPGAEDYTVGTDGTHSFTCVCGTAVTEAHTYVDGTCACDLVKTYTVTLTAGYTGVKIVAVNGEDKEILPGGTFTVPHGQELKVKFVNTVSQKETGVHCDAWDEDWSPIDFNYDEATNTMTIPANEVNRDIFIDAYAYVSVQFNLHGGALTDEGKENLEESFGCTWVADTSTLKATYGFSSNRLPDYFQLDGHTLAGAKVDGSEEVVRQLEIRSDMTVDILWECDGTAILTPVPAKDATCTEAGNIAHYVCTCGKLYEDDAGTKELTAEDVKTDIDPTNHVENGFDSATGKCACGVELAVAKVTLSSEETTYYTSIIDAVAGANGSGNATITLLQNTTTGKRLDINQSATLDLNGNTLSCATNFSNDYDTMVAVTTDGAKLTIIDSIGGGKLDGTGTTFVLYLGDPSRQGVVTFTSSAQISGGTVSGGVRMRSGTSMTVSDGTLENNAALATIEMYSETTLNVSGGEILNTAFALGAISNTDGGTVIISGGTVNASGDYAVAIWTQNSGRVEISGGNIFGSQYDLRAYSEDTVELTGGTFPGGITVNGKTLNACLGDGFSYWAGNTMLTVADDAASITDKGEITIRATCNHSGNSNEATDNGDGTHSYTCTVCGTFVTETHSTTADGDEEATCVSKAYCSVCESYYGELGAHAPDATGKCTVDGCGYQYPAKVDDTFYESIHKALRAAEEINGCTLTLLDNITIAPGNTAPYVNKGTFTLDLNGNTISSNASTLQVMNTANLTIKDSVGGGKIVSTYSNAIYQTGGKLTIESGTFEGTLDGVFLSYDSTLIVKGGTFTGSRAMITGFGSDCEIDLTAIDPAGFTLKNNGSGTFAPTLPSGYAMVNGSGTVVTSLSAEESATVKASLENATVTLDKTTFTYDGQPHMPTVTVVLGDKPLTLGVDYTVIYAQAMTVQGGKPVKWFGTGPSESECINAGSLYFAVVEGIGNYYTEDTVTLCENFVIAPRPLTVKADDQTILVGGQINEESVTVTEGSLVAGHTLTASIQLGQYTEAGSVVNQPGFHEDVLTILKLSCDIMDGEEYVTDNYSISFVSGNLTVVEHVHEWSYSADGATITATCANTDGRCPDAEQSITISAVGKTYDGTPVTATLDISGEDLTAPTITYFRDGEEINESAIKPGTYTASITLGEGENAATASVEFTITIPEALLSPETPNGENGWYTSASLLAPNGYAISTIQNGTFGASLDLEDGTCESFTYWLTYEENQDCEPVSLTWTGSIQIDGTAPTVSGAAASVTDSTASITVSAKDENSGVASTALTCTDSSVTIGELTDGAFPVSGMQPNTPYTFTLTVKDAAGNEASATVQLTTEKGTSSVTKAPAANKLTYTGTAQTLATAGEAKGGEMQYSLDNQNWSASIPTGTIADTYTVYYKVVGDSNHNDTDVKTVEVTIAKAEVSIAAAPTPNTLTYIGEGRYLISPGEAVGGTMLYSLTENGDYTTSIPQGTNAGEYTVWYYVQGDANHNDSAKDSVPVNIAKATVTVTADAKSKPYGTDNPTLTYTSEGLLGDDALTGALETTATKTSSVGEYDITVGSLANSNYTIDFVGAKLTITKAAAPEIQWPTAAALTYGQKLSDSTLTSQDENGTFAWQDGSIVPTVKNNGYVVVYTPKDTDNYDYSTVTLTETIPVTVSKAEPSIVWNSGYTNSYGNNMYITAYINGVDGNLIPGTATATVYDANGNALSNVTCTKTDSTGTYFFNWLNQLSDSTYLTPGEYLVKLTYQGSDNYTEKTVELVTYTIHKRALTVTANDNVITYGDAPSANGVEYSGFVDGETEAVLGGELTYSYNYEQYGNVGTYTITPSGLTSGNYEITFKTGKLTVNAKGITVTADAVSKTYGDADPELTYTASGLVNGDKLSGALTREVGTDIGTYAITQGTLTAGSNYTINYTGATLTINKKPITEADVTLNGSLTYTGSEQTQPITVTEGITYTVTGDKATDVGTYELTVNGTDNYTGEVKLSWSIKEATAIVDTAPTANNLTYNGEDQALVTAGTTTDGTMMYKLGEDGEYTNNIPTGNAAGDYIVWYYVKGDANHADSAPASVSVKIKKAAADYEDPAANTLTYNGSTHALVTEGTTADGTIMYKLGENGTYSATVPSAENAGTYTVYYYVKGDSNHEDSAEQKIDVTIGQLDITGKTVDITLAGSLIYNGAEQTMGVSSVKLDALTVTYTVSGNTGTNADSYVLTVTGTDNFKGTATKEWSIAKKSVTITAKDQTITYGETISGTEITATGLVDGHSATVTLTPSTTNVAVSGTITASTAVITADGTDVTGNYNVNYTSGKLVIKPDTSKIDALTTDNVTSADEEDIKAVQAMMASAETDGVDEATAAQWAAITATCEDLIDKIEVVEAENARIADAVSEFDLATVKSSDETAISQLISDIDDQLATNNLTDEERSELEGLKTKCNNLIAKIDGTETLIGQLDKTVDDLDAETVKSTDKDTLEQVIEDAQTLIDSGNVTEAEKEALVKTQEDAEALIKVIDDTAAENKELTDQAASFDEDTVKSTDKENLEQLAEDIEDLLDTDNLTEDERETLETVLEQVEGMIDTIEDTAEDSKAATDAIDALDPATVTSDDKDDLEQAIETIDELLKDDHLTEDERKALEDAKADAEALIDVIEAAQEATDTENTEKVEDVTDDNVKPEDKEALEEAKADLEKALEDNAGNYTEEEKQAIRDEIQRIDDAIEALENVEDVTDSITQLPETVEPDDEEAAEKILDAKEAYDELTDHEKSLVDEDTKKKLDDLVASLTAYDIIKGDGGKWTKGGSSGLTFTANGPFSKFVGIEVDGKEVDEKYYDAKAGSTIITLKQSYLKRLSTGEHTITVLYTDGETSGTFKILAASSTPATGDNSNIMLWSGVLGVSTLGLVVLLADRKRRKSTK